MLCVKSQTSHLLGAPPFPQFHWSLLQKEGNSRWIDTIKRLVAWKWTIPSYTTDPLRYTAIPSPFSTTIYFIFCWVALRIQMTYCWVTTCYIYQQCADVFIYIIFCTSQKIQIDTEEYRKVTKMSRMCFITSPVGWVHEHLKKLKMVLFRRTL